MNFKDIHSIDKRCLRWSVNRLAFITFPLLGWIIAWYYDYYSIVLVILSALFIVVRYTLTIVVYLNIKRYKFVSYEGLFTLAKYRLGRWRLFSVINMDDCVGERWYWTIKGRIAVYKVKGDDIILCRSASYVRFPRVFGKRFKEQAKKEIFNNLATRKLAEGSLK